MKRSYLAKTLTLTTLFITALLSGNILLHAQVQNLKFTQVSEIDGFSLGKINAITHDSYGFLWLSDQTNRCVIRYDGSQIKRYTDKEDDSVTLGGFYPECLYADEDGVMWIGFYGQGLDRLDPKTNTVTHYDHDPLDPGSLSDNYVTSIEKDSEGNIWVGHYAGVDVLDVATGTFKNYSFNPDDENSLSYHKVRKLYRDREGTMWVGAGFPWDGDENGGLNRYNPETDNFTRFMHDPDNPNSLVDNPVRAIFEDSKGNFWIGTRGDGLHSMDRTTGQITRHPYNPDFPNRLSRPPITAPFDHVTFITEDANGHLWIGTNISGIARYDPSTLSTNYFGVTDSPVAGFEDHSGWWAQPGPDGLLWIATEESNLYKVELDNHTIPKEELEYEGFAYFQGRNGNFFTGTDNGFIIEDQKTGVQTRYTRTPDRKDEFGHVHVIFGDRSGLIWIGTHQGLYQFNPDSKTFLKFTHNPENPHSISANDIEVIYEDSESLIWIGTNASGLNQYDPKTNQFTRYRYDPSDLSSISSDYVLAILQEDDEHLLIGAFDNAGLNRINIQTAEITRFFPGLSILYLFKDHRGTIWVGSHNGLYLKEANSEEFVALVDHNPDINVPARIRSIIEDDQYNLWFGTDRGLYRMNKDRSHLVLYDEDNGINFEINRDLADICKLSDGTLIFSSRSSHYIIDPTEFKSHSYDINIFFTDLLINGNEVYNETGQNLQTPIIDATYLKLKYNQNSFALDANALNFRSSGDKRIQYILHNYDPEWRDLDPGEKISYFKVPSGQYQLEVKTANLETGQWFNKSLDITIAKPWWAQWWAYILYAFLFAFGAWRVHLYQKARLLKAEEQRNREKELAHAREIKKAYTKLKNTQSQLIQSEKMASLGELTAGIAHEIQNPLNFVNNFSEVNKEILQEIKEEIDNGNFEEVKDLAGNAIENEEKIIHHGKRADSIVKNMLQHSRGNVRDKEAVGINALCDEYLRLTYHGLRAKDKSFNALFEINLDPKIEKIQAVPQDIGRVLLNILNNAFYAVDQKSKSASNGYEPRVEISTKKIKDQVEITVLDNGDGIPQEIIDKIFQPFFTTKPTGQGTGLGLSLAYDIVTKGHGGELEVDSNKGDGTAFRIHLPID